MFDDDNLPTLISKRLRDSIAAPDAEPFPERYFSRPAQPAAVLMPLVRQTEGWHLVLIRRALDVRDRHSGEVALPGGRVERGDANVESAALREASEEIGLDAMNVRLLGRMAPYRSVSNFRITPVVAQVLAPFEPRPDPREVARVFSIPLQWLADPRNLERRSRQLDGTELHIEVLHYRPYAGEHLWGVTARLVDGLISAIADESAPPVIAGRKVGK